jgi:hypothetical protein
MQFGTKETTHLLDDEGSTMAKTEKANAGVVAKPVRIRYEIRHRTDKTDLETLARIGYSLINDPAKLDTALKFEHTKYGDQQAYFYIVECYTLLEY